MQLLVLVNIGKTRICHSVHYFIRMPWLFELHITLWACIVFKDRFSWGLWEHSSCHGMWASWHEGHSSPGSEVTGLTDSNETDHVHPMLWFIAIATCDGSTCFHGRVSHALQEAEGGRGLQMKALDSWSAGVYNSSMAAAWVSSPSKSVATCNSIRVRSHHTSKGFHHILSSIVSNVGLALLGMGTFEASILLANMHFIGKS